jgi:hypothetical protein
MKPIFSKTKLAEGNDRREGRWSDRPGIGGWPLFKFVSVNGTTELWRRNVTPPLCHTQNWTLLTYHCRQHLWACTRVKDQWNRWAMTLLSFWQYERRKFWEIHRRVQKYFLVGISDLGGNVWWKKQNKKCNESFSLTYCTSIREYSFKPFKCDVPVHLRKQENCRRRIYLWFKSCN